MGSTQLSSLLDPEDYRDVIALVGAALAPYRGHVARFLGDGILVLFGTESNKEHTTENTVAAAMEVLRRTSASMSVVGTKLQIRIGLVTGMTVVERPFAADPDNDRVVGQILILAARQRAVAEPDCVVVSQATHDRIGGLFVCLDLGLQDLKRIEGLVHVWKVISISKLTAGSMPCMNPLPVPAISAAVKNWPGCAPRRLWLAPTTVRTP